MHVILFFYLSPRGWGGAGGNLFKIGLNNLKGGGFGGRGDGLGAWIEFAVVVGCIFVWYALFTIKNPLLLNF